MRFVGLADDAGVYQSYRVPNPQAPYPQDYVVDQQGIVQYWSDQFDPQEVIGVIDRLLAAGVEQKSEDGGAKKEERIEARPNPFRAGMVVNVRSAAGAAGLEVFNAAGRRVRVLRAGRSTHDAGQEVVWNGDDEAGRPAPAGVYYLTGPGTQATPLRLLR